MSRAKHEQDHPPSGEQAELKALLEIIRLLKLIRQELHDLKPPVVSSLQITFDQPTP